MRYNWLKLLKEGFNNNSGWEKTWRNPELGNLSREYGQSEIPAIYKVIKRSF